MEAVKPQTVQTVRLLSGKWVVHRWSVCPDHLSKTTDFQGVSEAGDLFRCKETPQHLSHLFYSTPDPRAPCTPAEAGPWLEAEIQRVRVDPKKAGQ